MSGFRVLSLADAEAMLPWVHPDIRAEAVRHVDWLKKKAGVKR